jgi:hypothetical protein
MGWNGAKNLPIPSGTGSGSRCQDNECLFPRRQTPGKKNQILSFSTRTGARLAQ